MMYISDDQVIINTQGLRTVGKQERSLAPGHYLTWSYKGQEHFQAYDDQAARDAMYEKLRDALMAEKERGQNGGYSKINAIRTLWNISTARNLNIPMGECPGLVEALEPIMRPKEEKARC